MDDHLYQSIQCKKSLAVFSFPAGMSLTKLSMDRNNLIIPRKSLVSDIPAGDRKTADLFLQCTCTKMFPNYVLDPSRGYN